jgi:hypothetical protein
MKIRSFLLFACMIVVPLLAMFSHKIPPDFRQAARRHLWEPAQRALAGGETVPEPAAVAAMPTVAISDTPVPPAPVHAAASPPANLDEIEGRLAALGGFAVECAPVAADGGLHRCSCRVAADPSGQLQRVFQSSGRDPAAAMQQLLEQVEVWKERIASSPQLAPARRF